MPEHFFRNQKILAASMERISQNSRGEDDNTNGLKEWHYNDSYDEVMAKYYQLIYAVDVAVGMIREAVETAGVKHKTLIIFTSDNGYLCGSHGYGSKVLPYEESSRVPLIIYDPRSEKKADRCNVVTGNIDLAATILDAALGRPNHGNGTSLLKHCM